jgi:hypothetical protein
MGKVLSIDLACSCVRNLGICLLEEDHGRVVACNFLQPSQVGVTDPPIASLFANAIYTFCVHESIGVAMLDGPQAWKDPRSGLVHSRLCERMLNAPAKTGILGQVKPANYTRFVEFSIAIFASLVERGAILATNPEVVPVLDRLLVLESLPLAAWRKLKIAPLPAKAKATVIDREEKFRELARRFGLDLGLRPSHDELQALVSGLAGVAISGRNPDGYLAEGSAPFQIEGSWVEGFIVNPRMRL